MKRRHIKRLCCFLLNAIVILTILSSISHAASDSPKDKSDGSDTTGIDKGVILKLIDEQLLYAASHNQSGGGIIFDLFKVEVELTEVIEEGEKTGGKFVIPIFKLGKTNEIKIKAKRTNKFTIEPTVHSFAVSSPPSMTNTFFYDTLQDIKRNVSSLTNPVTETSPSVEFILTRSGESEKGGGVKFEFMAIPFDISGQGTDELKSTLAQKITYYLKIRKPEKPEPSRFQTIMFRFYLDKDTLKGEKATGEKKEGSVK